MSKETGPLIFIGYIRPKSDILPCLDCPAKGEVLSQMACLPAYFHRFPGKARAEGISPNTWRGKIPPECPNKFKNSSIGPIYARIFKNS